MALKWFRGDGSFIRNHYAIFEEGLGEHHPNEIAIDRGLESGLSLLGKISSHGNSSFSKLVYYLERVQIRERQKEQAYIREKLAVLKETLPEEYYSKIATAFEKEDFSVAYTMIQNCHKDLESLRKELNSPKFRSFQKMSSFWETSFSKYLGEKLPDLLKFEGNKLISTNSNVSIEDIVDEFLVEKLGASDGLIAHGLEEEREKYIKQLEEVFRKKGIIPQNWDSARPLFDQRRKKDYSTLAKNITKNKSGKSKSLKVIGEEVGKSVMKGIGSEIQAAVNAKKAGGATVLTGRFLRDTASLLGQSLDTRVQQKGDLLVFDVFSKEYDLEPIIKNIFNDKPDITLKQLEEEIARALPALEIFEVSENIKGYQTYNDLNIEQDGSFDRRLGNLGKLIDDDKAFDKLIFLLVNTTEGCLFDRRTNEIGNYLAAVFAAWMWDDYEEMFNLKNHSFNYKKLHIFNSGGAYFTASGLMEASIELLKEKYGKDNLRSTTDSLVKVNISPGRYTDSEYMKMVNSNEYGWPQDVNTLSDAEVQERLKKRWDAVRAAALERGTMNVTIQQKELDKLLGNLKAIIEET